MALRLAGEEFSVVQGLDGQGWVEETQAPLFKAQAIQAAVGKTIGWGDIGFRRAASTRIDPWNGTSVVDMQVRYLEFLNDIYPAGSSGKVRTSGANGAILVFDAMKDGVGTEEVARLQGGPSPTLDLLKGRLTGDLNASGKGIIGLATATAATAGSQSLPANPAGFLIIETGKKVPYYNT